MYQTRKALRMKCISVVLTTLFLISCQESRTYTFKEIPCPYAETPDLTKQPITDLNSLSGENGKDTLGELRRKGQVIFKPCREYIYRAVYKAKDGTLLSDSRVWMMATGRSWMAQPDVQEEMAMQFEVTEKELVALRKHFVNRKFASLDRITNQETTGVIETPAEVWMHPFRSNQFNFTEVAGFPNVQLPLVAGKTWSNEIYPGKGWGDWANTTVHNFYQVKGQENLVTKFKEFKNAWKVVALSTAPFGKSVHTFWFDKFYGFVRMEYLNYEGQTLTFDLEEVIEK